MHANTFSSSNRHRDMPRITVNIEPVFAVKEHQMRIDQRRIKINLTYLHARLSLSSSSFLIQGPQSPEPAGVCHICDGPLLEQLSAPSSLKLKFPHESLPISSFSTWVTKLTSARSLSRTGASPERTNVEGKWSTRGWRGVMKQGGCWWGHLWRDGWHGDDGLQ